MEYFSEIYGSYYSAVAAVLERAAVTPLSEKEITEIINENAFSESALYIVPKLISGEWPLLVRNESGLYSPVTRHNIKIPLTFLQRAWLSSVLEDERCGAFFDENERAEIKASLAIEPLYDSEKVKAVDACSDGDDFSNTDYSNNFKLIMNAIREKELLHISYTGGSGSRVSGDFLPCRLEYSPKDDKMRLVAAKMRKGSISVVSTINLGRVTQVTLLGKRYEGEADIDTLLQKSKQTEPAVIELTDKRNALERFMVQFASYDKHTRHNEDTDTYICSIFYNKADETELLIRLLSFGPVIKIISPESLVSEAKRRINRQFELMGRYL